MKTAEAFWRVWRYDAPTAAAQMAIDEQLAHSGEPVVRLFCWSPPAVSYGFRQSPPAWATTDCLRREGVESVERPTGGGLAVHGSDVSCSIAVPIDAVRSLRQLLSMTCEVLVEAVQSFGVSARGVCDVDEPRLVQYCLTETSPYAVMVGSRKLCGLAARRFPQAWLVQGSLLLKPLPEVFARLMPEAVQAEFCRRAISLEDAVGAAVAVEEFGSAMWEAWMARWDAGTTRHSACSPRPERMAAHAV